MQKGCKSVFINTVVKDYILDACLEVEEQPLGQVLVY